MRMVKKLSFAAALGVVAFVSACSDPVPPPPQAVVSIVLNTASNPEVTGNCSAPHTANIPVVPSYSGNIVTDSGWQDMLTDGNTGSVSCTVKPTGSGYSVSGTATITQDTTPQWGTISVDIPQIAEGQSDAIGTISVGDHATAGDPYTGSCKFSVSGGRLQVAKGRIWGTVTCDEVRILNYPGATCAVGRSYFIFQNCKQ